MLNSAEYEINPAHKCKNANNCWHVAFISRMNDWLLLFKPKISFDFGYYSIHYIPTYLYMLNFPLPSGNIGQFFVLKKAQSCDYAKIPYYTSFGTASISLVGFAHTRSFQDGDQKHG